MSTAKRARKNRHRTLHHRTKTKRKTHHAVQHAKRARRHHVKKPA